MSPLRALKWAGADDRRCPCGWADYDGRTRAWHAKRHLDWAIGLEAPTAAKSRICQRVQSPFDQVLVVNRAAPFRWRQLAYEMARLAQREGRHDFASFPAPVGRRGPGEDDSTAYLALRDGSVVGYLVCRQLPVNHRWDFASSQPQLVGRPVIRTVIELVWTAFHWRHRGIGSELIRAAACHAQIPVEELAWGTPFSDAGLGLARSLEREVWVE